MKLKSIMFVFLIFFIGCQQNINDSNTTVDTNETNLTINHAPEILTPSLIEVPENVTKAFTIEAKDADGDKLRYGVSGLDSGYFNVNSDTGEVSFKTPPDYESGKTKYNIIVSVSDGVHTSNKEVEIDIRNVNDENSLNDKDNDYIPDDIEIMLGMDPNDPDENNNGILDGMDTNGTFGDKFFDKEWHIISLGNQVNPFKDSITIQNNDLNIIEVYHKYMGYNKGNPIIIQVIDTGVDITHEDLVDNINLSLSRDSASHKWGTTSETQSHGTMCAGIIAARAFNGVGVRGVAPFANIAGNNWLEYQSSGELETVWNEEGIEEGKIAIASNSWGVNGINNSTIFEELMEYGVKYLRIVNGISKGKLFIKAAGNGREDRGDACLSYANSNPYVITVAALDNNNTHTSYSSPGSCLWVSGYAGEYFFNSPTIATTYPSGKSQEVVGYNYESQCFVNTKGECVDLDDGLPTWPEDIKRNYTYAMNGTSAATPMVAGSLGLVLEACPNLTYREIKYLLAKDSIQVDKNNSSWVVNAAGFHHSVDYGFGLINVAKMIEDCTNNNYKVFVDNNYDEINESFSNINKLIPDLGEIEYNFTVDNNLTIEWLSLTIDSNHTYASDLEIYLVSPSGTKTRLILGNNLGSQQLSNWMDGGFRFGSAAFYGENTKGVWRLIIKDIAKEDSGVLKSIQFKVYGYKEIE